MEIHEGTELVPQELFSGLLDEAWALLAVKMWCVSGERLARPCPRAVFSKKNMRLKPYF